MMYRFLMPKFRARESAYVRRLSFVCLLTSVRKLSKAAVHRDYRMLLCLNTSEEILKKLHARESLGRIGTKAHSVSKLYDVAGQLSDVSVKGIMIFRKRK